ncbi:CaiB/BaiF CoA transferase family protein [Sphaerisporangium krabiense]|uniref:Crotonobetainyl-CoA:carnitine CoA-transferase CaiB-like acyl-CoA transferase n=1 Tax=Sphaerisporangium krabiense TaxID=763782 RepID=A0A7W9DP76_9ACTN|nr:CaiB/BaiF CoA-transferase family protein [Sphaerisporangium krabiense]MBB5626152.1 crotonobetainyl-CoA:carnitine CoA-transferase CaiB-like acyl-CoA transferase [Sphaerisporangium krabiense]
MTPSGPLSGVRIVTFAPLYQGPYATTLLADLGADVVTVERPGTGDGARLQGVMFAALNRGKRSVALNLKAPEDQETARRLAGTADVLVEAFRPGTMERYGLGYPRLSAGHPGLVYVSLSGFGQDGPYRDRAGHDLMYQAAAGLLDGLVDRPGAVHPPPELEAGAIVGALYAALGALAGLVGRAATGRGTHVDLSTHEALLSVMSLRLEPVLNGSGAPAPEPGPEPGYGLYRCADRRLIALGIGFEDHFWALLCEATGLTAYAGLTQAERAAQGGTLAGLLSEALSTRTYAHWQELFDRIGVPAGPVHRLREIPDDPHVRARQAIRALNGGDGRRYVRQPLRFSGYGAPDPAPAPGLGEHTASLLRELDASPHHQEVPEP